VPRLSTLRLEALHDLVSELRYAPRTALLRCIERTESLALEIEEQTNYPVEWIVFRVTGYRPKDAPDEVIMGAALIEDLSALLEHLCEAADLRSHELGEPYASIDDLAERWTVSRKTIERYRRQGLVARRYTDPDGVARLGFAARVVDAFEDRRADRLDRAAAFERIGQDERVWLYRRALRYRERLGWSFARIAQRLSEKSGRSVAAVRRALLRADESSTAPGGGSETPVFRVRRKLPERQSQAIARAVDWGIKPGLIAERYGRSRASVLRIATDEHARRLREAQPAILPDDAPAAIAHEAWEGVLGSPGARNLPVGPPILEAKALLNALAEHPSIEARSEAEIAAAHWALLVRAGRAIDVLPGSMASPVAVDEIETDLRWALLLRRALVESQMPLVVRSLEERLGGQLLSARPEEIRSLMTRAIRVVIGAAASFHPMRAARSIAEFGRLASPVSLALARSLSQSGLDQIRPAERIGRAATARADLEDWTTQLAPWQALIQPHPRLGLICDDLDEEDGALVRGKFGLDGRPPMASAALGEAFGASPARVVSAYRRARHAIRQQNNA